MRKLALATALAAAIVGLGLGTGSASALEMYPCPAGYKGIIIEHNGRQTSFCWNFVP